MESPSFVMPSRLDLARCTLTTGPPPLRDVPAPAGIRICGRSDPEMPAWARFIVDYRDFFGTCALAFRVAGEAEYWKVVYAAQSPKPYLAVCKLELFDYPSLHCRQEQLLHSWRTPL